MTDHPTPGSPLSADDVGLLWAMHVIGPDDIWAAPDHATAVKWCAYVNDELAPRDTTVLTVAVPILWPYDRLSHTAALPKSIEDWTLPTDRRAEAEAGKKHGPKCWGRTSYSDEMAHCYCEDTPPSAGLDAGLVERGYAWSIVGSDWWNLSRSPSIAIEGAVFEPLVTRQSAAAALEAAAEREGAALSKLSEVAHKLCDMETRAFDAEAQVAELREEVAKLLSDILAWDKSVNYRLPYRVRDPIYSLMDRQALSAIPTPGRE